MTLYNAEDYSQVVAEVTIIDDRRVEASGILFHDLVYIIGNQTSRLPILRINLTKIRMKFEHKKKGQHILYS